jgi:hypothetical protein
LNRAGAAIGARPSTQVKPLEVFKYDIETQDPRRAGADADHPAYRGDLVHRALVRTMEVALGLGRVRYRAVELRQADIEKMPRTA